MKCTKRMAVWRPRAGLIVSGILMLGIGVGVARTASQFRGVPLAEKAREILDRDRIEQHRLESALRFDDVEALDVQRRIELRKQRGETEILRAQARHARARGRADIAARIDMLLEEQALSSDADASGGR